MFIIPCKNLTARYAAASRLIFLNIRNSNRFYPPCVVNEKFSINANHIIQDLLICLCNLCHIIYPCLCKSSGKSMPHSPEICEWSVMPQRPLITFLIKFTDKIFRMFRSYIKCNLCKIKISTYAARCPNPHCIKYILHNTYAQFFRSHSI